MVEFPVIFADVDISGGVLIRRPLISSDWPKAIYSIASASFISPLRSSFTTEDRSIPFLEAIFSTKAQSSSSR
jgi:hypothetical protein